MDSVALVRSRDRFGEDVGEAVGLIDGFGDLRSPVIIKPNLCTDEDVTGVATTSAEAVKALMNLMLEEDGDLSIRIVESDSESKYADRAFEKLGYKGLVREFQEQGFDVSLVNLSDEPLVRVEFNGSYFKRPEIPRILTGGGYFISLAVAKTHSLTLITGVLKNQFGLLPRKDQSFYHSSINKVIVDLNNFIKPDLCIVDARKGLEGVLSGKVRPVNAVIVGRNPVSVDATLARLMGFKPERIRHIVAAEEYELGTLRPRVLGEKIESMTVEFKPPHNLSPKALIY